MGWGSTSAALAQHLKLLLSNQPPSNKRSSKVVLLELQSLAEAFGPFVHIPLIRALLDVHAELRSLSSNNSTKESVHLRFELLAECVSPLFDRPDFPTRLAQAISLGAARPVTEENIRELAKALKLPLSRELSLALGLIDSGPDKTWRSEGSKYLLTLLTELAQLRKEIGDQALRDRLNYPGDLLVHRALLEVGKSVHLTAEKKSQLALALCVWQKEKEAADGNALSHTGLCRYLRPVLLGDLGGSLNTSGVLNAQWDLASNVPRKAPMGDSSEILLQRLSASPSPAKVLEELGYACAATQEKLVEVLVLMPQLDETSIAAIVGTIARTYSGLEGGGENGNTMYASLCAAIGSSYNLGTASPSTWNVEVVVDAINKVAPDTDWVEVARRLDQPDFVLRDENAFRTLIALYRHSTQEPFPLEVVAGGSTWRNEVGQLSFLHHAVAAPPEMFPEWSFVKRQASPLEGLHAGASPHGTANRCWLALDLLQTLVRLGDLGHMDDVRAILEHPVTHCPEVLLVGLVQCSAEWGQVHEEALATLMPTYLGNHPNSSLILQHLWQLNHKAVLVGMVELYAKDNGAVARLLDICQELQALTAVLDATPYTLALDLAALAARREYLNLEKWLTAVFAQRGLPFVHACINFLGERATKPAEQLLASGKMGLAVETMVVFFKVIHVHMGLLPPELQEEAKSVYVMAINAHHTLQGGVLESASQPSGAVSGEAMLEGQAMSAPGGFRVQAQQQPQVQTEVFSPDVEEEANTIFQKIYTSEQSIGEVVQMLQAYHSSSVARERDIFSCMINNLYDEYRFFPKYPDKELLITASLFGKLIQYGLVVSLTLGQALRYVLESLRNPRGSKMFTFGVEALDQFRSRLPDWPQYCGFVLDIPHLHDDQPEMVEAIKRSMVGRMKLAGDPGSLARSPGGQGNKDPIEQGGGGTTGTAGVHQGALALGMVTGAGSLAMGGAGSASGGMGDLGMGMGSIAGSMGGTGGGAEGGDSASARTQQGVPAAKAGGPGANLRMGADTTGAAELDMDMLSAATAMGASLEQALTPPTSQMSAATSAAGSAVYNAAMSAFPSAGSTKPPTAPSSVGGATSVQQQPKASESPSMTSGPGSTRTSPIGTPQASPLRPAATMSSIPRNTVAPKLEPSLSGGLGFATALNLETLMQAEGEAAFPQPDEGVVDKIHFLVNNLSQQNLQQKAVQLNSHLRQSHMLWFAQYMVVKRASIEPNFHALYLALIDKVQQTALLKEVVRATVRNVNVLLASDKIKTNSGERSLLKNLGSWLGQLTISRNKPVLMRDLNPKRIIFEAYERGRMIAVIPFVSKLLEACKNSKVYKPPNPWLMAILGLLVEIYNEKDLKLNLKFEVEMLFKHLSINKDDVPPTSLLSNYERDRQSNSDWTVDKSIMQQQQAAAAAAAANSKAQSAGVASSQPGPGQQLAHVVPSTTQAQAAGVMGGKQGDSTPSRSTTPVVDSEASGPMSLATMLATNAAPLFNAGMENALPHLGSFVHINPSLGILAERLHLKRMIPVAIERAIREMGTLVVERSVTIGCMTTRELILKDFAMEPDEKRMRKAASYMVVSLSGNLALATCKEPMRLAVATQLRQMVLQLPVAASFSSAESQAVLEQAIQVAAADNMMLGCALIEKATTERALKDINEALAPAYAVRRKHREAGQAYYDMSGYSQGPYPSTLPEVLRPKPGHLQFAKQSVYEDFAQLTSSAMGALGGVGAPPYPPMPNGPPPILGAVDAGLGSILSSRHVPVAIPAGAFAGGLGGPSLGQLLQPSAAEMADAQAAMDPVSAEADLAAALGMPGVGSLSSGEPKSSSAMDAMRSSLGMGYSFGAQDPLGAAAAALAGSGTESLSTGAVMEMHRTLMLRVEALVAQEQPAAAFESLPAEHALRVAAAEVRETVRAAQSAGEAALAVAQKVFKKLYEGPQGSRMHVTTHLALLEHVRDVHQRLVKELTTWVIYSDEDRKLNQEIVEGLVRARLLSLTEFDSHVAKLMNGGRHAAATEFATHLVHQCILLEPMATAADFFNVLDVLGKVAQRPGAPENLGQLVEQARNASAATLGGQRSGTPMGRTSETSRSHTPEPTLASGPGGAVSASANSLKASLSADPASDPPGLRESVAAMFEEWARLCDSPAGDEGQLAFATQLQLAGLLQCDETTERVLRILIELATAHCLSTEPPRDASLVGPHGSVPPPLNFAAIDACARLVMLLVKFLRKEAQSKEGTGGSAPVERGLHLVLFKQALDMSATVLCHDMDERGPTLNPRPFFRLFAAWLTSLAAPDPAVNPDAMSTLWPITRALLTVQPARIPGFAFAYLELIAHRAFLPRLLLAQDQKGWPLFQRLLSVMLKFMEPYLRSAKLSEPVRLLYKGTLRVLLVLLHDFPEFLCDQHFNLCDNIPPSCIQMRNLVLSAFPRNMRLPDPFTPNLKVDLLPEISQSPRILAAPDHVLLNKQMHAQVDHYMSTRQPANFCEDLRAFLLLPPHEASACGTRYNVPMLNALVLYMGMQAIAQLKSVPTTKAKGQNQILQSVQMEVFQYLVEELDTEGRYLLLNAIANQLRYPNNHTHYFSCILLYLFGDAQQEIIQEQVTRVLLERLIVNRPHPWGLLITFIELIKNPRYKFWSHGFTRCAPEIEKLFESVARSCMGPPLRSQEDDVSGVMAGLQVSE